MRTILTIIFGVCLAVFVYVDHLKVQTELSNLDTSQLIVRQEYIDNYQSQETTKVLVKMLETANKRLVEYQRYLVQYKETNARLETVVNGSAMTIKDLTTDNANLQRRLDYITSQHEGLLGAYKDIVKQLETSNDLVLKLSSDKKKLSDLLSKMAADLKAAREQVDWYKNQCERATGQVAPMPPNTLK